MSIVQALREDHDAIRTLLTQISEEKGLTFSERKLLFPKAKALVLAHADAEERCLYAPLKDSSALHGQILEGLEEHRISSQLLDELAAENLVEEMWMAKFNVFRALLVHHLKEEEEDLFPESEKELSARNKSTSGEPYEELKDKIISDQPRSV